MTRGLTGARLFLINPSTLGHRSVAFGLRAWSWSSQFGQVGGFGAFPGFSSGVQKLCHLLETSLVRPHPHCCTAMPRLLQPLWLILASVTDRRLAQMVEYLKEENRILRSRLPRNITVTARERNRLIKLGKRLGSAINELISIVTPRSFARWVVGDRVPKRRRVDRKPGRPRTAEEIRELILRLACETGWG
jgi:hypothetical protein